MLAEKSRLLLISTLISISFLGQALGKEPTKITYPSLSKSAFHELELLSAAIVSDCKPPECLTIFLGRSSTYISAYLEATGQLGSLSLPGSSLMNDSQGVGYAQFSEKVLDPLVSPHLGQGVQRMEVVDFVSTGESLARGTKWLSQFLKEQDARVEVSAKGYGRRLSAGALRSLEGAGLRYKAVQVESSSPVAASELYNEINAQEPEYYAAYERWVPQSAQNYPIYNRNINRIGEADSFTGKQKTLHASYNELVENFRKRANDVSEMKRSSLRCLRSIFGF